MSYNNFPTIGVPGSGFASRGKGAHIQRLSFEPSQPLDNGIQTPRTSRSHLLAGLRTAPKSATYPPSAPPSQQQHHAPMDNSLYVGVQEDSRSYGAKTSVGSSFPSQHNGYKANRQSIYSVPEVLAPPEIRIDDHETNQMDPNLYAQLVATNLYLAEQQRQLQQQLANVQAATQQFNGLNINQSVAMMQQQQQFATPPITPNASMYQQSQQNMQPVISQVPGATPGICQVYDPMTGQMQYFYDNNAAAQQTGYGQNMLAYNGQQDTSQFNVSPPSSANTLPFRTASPPKSASSPSQDHSPLPPPSANAFRRGHKKASSMAIVTNASADVDSGPRTALPKTAGVPQTPMTGLFGPGQARAGEHPIRQPKGPPALEELKAKPTVKFEGSKNFAARQRRSAVNNLVRAGLERRRGPGSAGSAGSITPISEHGEITFSLSSDNDSDSNRSGSGSLAGRPTIGGSRTSLHGAIGSDRPSSRSSQKQRSPDSVSVDSSFTAASLASEENTIGGSFAAVFKTKRVEAIEPPRKSMLVLTSSAEKRKSALA